MLTSLAICAFVFSHCGQPLRVAVTKHSIYQNNTPDVLARSGASVAFDIEHEGKRHQIRANAVLSLALNDQPGGVTTTMEQLSVSIPGSIPKDVLDFQDVEVSCTFTREYDPKRFKKQKGNRT